MSAVLDYSNTFRADLPSSTEPTLVQSSVKGT